VNLEEMNHQELVELIRKFKFKKKYGITWEEEKTREIFEEITRNSYPMLQEVKKYRLFDKKTKLTNFLIEGDNYHALSVLSLTHQGKIDFIYIDPPYNRGGKDFKYNDDYVDREDSYRHSKWLSFMNKRLILARDLLADHGIIFISIDDNEHSRLRLLCEEVFGESNVIGDISVVNNLKGRSDQGFFATAHEFLIVCTKDKSRAEIGGFPLDEDQTDEYDLKDEKGFYKLVGLQKTGKSSLREDRPNLFYPVYWNAQNNYLGIERKSKSDLEIFPLFSNGVEGNWRWSKENFSENCNSEIEVKLQKRGPVVYVKMRLHNESGEERTRKPKSFWLNPKFDSGSATSALAKMFGSKVFDNPKPIPFLLDILEIATTKDSLVLDFFAGSGSTGEAVLRANEADGGSREFILITNNEEKICSEITYPRMRNVIEGYTDAEGKKIVGTGSNLRFFRTNFVEKTENADEMKIRITENCIDLLCFKENVAEEIKDLDELFKVFTSAEKVIAIYISYDTSKLQNVKEILDNLKQPIKKLYCFTFDSEGLNSEDFEDWLSIEIEPIPQKILELLGAQNAN
jgi:adenine-specific DNA-methyltransferase